MQRQHTHQHGYAEYAHEAHAPEANPFAALLAAPVVAKPPSELDALLAKPVAAGPKTQSGGEPPRFVTICNCGDPRCPSPGQDGWGLRRVQVL